MRIIHTADWHLGNSIHSVDRTAEQKAFLDWLVQVIKEQDIEALIVAGDVFDTYTPSITAQRMYYSFLASLVSTGCKNVIIVGGNHDSGKMLEAPGEVLSTINVQVVGRMENKKIDDMIFSLRGSKEGDEVICAAVPYINELELRKFMADHAEAGQDEAEAAGQDEAEAAGQDEAEAAEQDEAEAAEQGEAEAAGQDEAEAAGQDEAEAAGQDEAEAAEQDEDNDEHKIPDGKFTDAAYTKVYSAFLEKAAGVKGDRDLPIIATGHLYAAGLEGRYEGVEKEEKTDDGVAVLDVVGNLGKVHIGCFPEGFDYVALGHIHYKTRVAKQSRVMYSGSPFVMGYDDANIDHYIVRLDIGEDGDIHHVKQDFITVPKWIRFERITGTKEEIVEKVTSVIESEKENTSETEPENTSETEPENTTPLYLELYYDPEDGSYLQEQIEALEFPGHVRVVSWRIKKRESTHTVSFGDYDIHSIQNISLEDVVKQLVLSKCSLSKEEMENMTEDEISKYEEDTVNTYLPYFMKAFDEVSKEENNEDN